MSSTEKLRLLLIRDVLCFAALTAYFFIPGDYKFVVILVPVVVLRLAGKKLKGSAKLEPPQRQTYFVVSILFLAVWILLVLCWIILHFSAPAIVMGSLGILVLLAFCLYMYESIVKHPTV